MWKFQIRTKEYIFLCDLYRFVCAFSVVIPSDPVFRRYTGESSSRRYIGYRTSNWNLPDIERSLFYQIQSRLGKAFRTTPFFIVIDAWLTVHQCILLSLFRSSGLFCHTGGCRRRTLFWIQCVSVKLRISNSPTTIFFTSVKNRTPRRPLAFLAFLPLPWLWPTIWCHFLPLLLLIHSKHWTSIKHRRHFITTGVLLFILGLAPVLYLPIRAAGKPLFCWHNPSYFRAFIAHVTGRQFHGLASGFTLELLLSRLGSIPKKFRRLSIPFWRSESQDDSCPKIFLGKVGALLGIVSDRYHFISSCLPYSRYRFTAIFWLRILLPAYFYHVSKFPSKQNPLIDISRCTDRWTCIYLFSSWVDCEIDLLRSYGKLMLASVPCTSTIL